MNLQQVLADGFRDFRARIINCGQTEQRVGSRIDTAPLAFTLQVLLLAASQMLDCAIDLCDEIFVVNAKAGLTGLYECNDRHRLMMTREAFTLLEILSRRGFEQLNGLLNRRSQSIVCYAGSRIGLVLSLCCH